jgi:hypothetical protein
LGKEAHELQDVLGHVGADAKPERLRPLVCDRVIVCPRAFGKHPRQLVRFAVVETAVQQFSDGLAKLHNRLLGLIGQN